VVRSIGNRAGRGRLTADIRLQKARPPRCLPLCTAEQWPTGESITARLFGVTMRPKMLDLERLNRAQAAGKLGTLARSMADHLSTAARDFAGYLERARADWGEYRQEAMNEGLTGRTPDQTAFLLVGYGLALGHWTDAGIIAPDQARALSWDARRVIFDLARAHERRIAHAQPADAFVSILTDLLLSGGAYLLTPDNNRPAVNADRYGWHSDHPDGAHIGWINEPKGEVWLLASPAFAAVADRGRRMDAPLNIKEAALWRQLRDRGVLLPGDPEQRDGNPIERTTQRRYVGTKQQKVLVFHLSVLGCDEGG
jgi:hypothetical protein